MSNEKIAQLFRNIAAAYEILGENRFRVLAYQKASESVKNSPIEVKELWQQNKLNTLPGIGKGISQHLDALFKSGQVADYEKLFKKLPAGMFILLDVPGFGAKKAFRLAKEFKLDYEKTAVPKLLVAANAGKIARLEGFGEKSQTDIIAAIKRYKKGQIKENRMPLPYAYVLAEEMIKYLQQHKDADEVIPLGSLRRMTATIGDIDIAIATRNSNAIIDWFLKYPKMAKIVESGPTGATILHENGRQIDIRVQTPENFGSMLQYFTGGKQHNISLREFALKKGFSLSEYGIKLIANKTQLKKIHNDKNKLASGFNKKTKTFEFKSEENFYLFLGLTPIPAELREDKGEIEASLNKKLPKLIENEDVCGDLHIHSNYNLEPSHDLGSSSLLQIISEAKKLGYEYVGISDHNPGIANHTKEQIYTIMKKRKHFFEHIMSSLKSVRVNIFIMMEIDILPDGSLALPDNCFDFIDAAIVSVHSRFSMDKNAMTKRILKGLTHPKARILGHPSGRLLGKRDGYDLEWSNIFDFCKDNSKALEINAYPDRLDLRDSLVYEAVKKQIKLIIDTDSHNKVQMNLIKYGVAVARRGWATKDDILNTLPYNMFKNWLQTK